MSVEVTDHTVEVIAELNDHTKAALESVGEQAVSYAKKYISEAGRRDTGAMINSINHEVVMSEKAVYIGTNIHYAIYNELGTGVYLDGGGGRQTPWRYRDAMGNWHTTRGIKPIHFLKKAAQDHSAEYRAIIEEELKK